MALRRASLASVRLLRSSASMVFFLLEASRSDSLQAGQRLAKPGLSGFSSNSSEQTAHTRIGNDIHVYGKPTLFYLDIVKLRVRILFYLNQPKPPHHWTRL